MFDEALVCFEDSVSSGWQPNLSKNPYSLCVNVSQEKSWEEAMRVSRGVSQ